MTSYLDFEKPILDLESKIEELRHLSSDGNINIADEVGRLQGKVDRLLRETYSHLTAAQKVQVARHGERPHFCDYASRLMDDFIPLAGDRNYAEDQALVGGLARFRGRSCVIMGHEKGHDTESRVAHNFGMARPEGYRKAQRLMNMADQFGLPVISFVDTAGAYPGVDAEARGQAEAIARSIETCIQIKVPFISVIIGEGGSGGAIAIAVADRVLMLEHATYSVISPEGCASILWRSAAQSAEAAEALRLTAQDLMKLGVIDEVIAEPLGGAHRHPEDTIASVGDAIARQLDALVREDGTALLSRRRQKFLDMGKKGI